MSVRFTPPALRRLLFIAGGLLLGTAARAQSPTIDPSFPPVQITQGNVFSGVADVVRQPDGKYLVAGDFSSINRQPFSNLARLNADGTLDAAFTAACAPNGAVSSLALLPDGRILVGGSFQTVGGGTQSTLARLQPDGTLDATFAPNFSGQSNSIGNVLVLPNGNVLATGTFTLSGATSGVQYMARFNGVTGQADPSFQYTLPTPDSRPTRMVLQPDGKVLISGPVPSYRLAAMLMRIEANGAADPSFSPVTNGYTGGVYTLALDGAGRIYAGGSYNGMAGNGSTLRRYLPNGTEDGSFTYNGTNSFVVGAVALQPNGQLLVASEVTQRLLPSGALDASYASANGPSGNPNSAFRKILVEPSGAILVAGAFSLPITTPGPGPTGIIGLARLNAANVLAVQPGAGAAHLAAWPVPAHDVLHLRLSAQAHHLQLLDALGRPVRSYQQPAAELSLPVAGLPAGSYQLRVSFADGSQATRRVLLQ